MKRKINICPICEQSMNRTINGQIKINQVHRCVSCGQFICDKCTSENELFCKPCFGLEENENADRQSTA